MQVNQYMTCQLSKQKQHYRSIDNLSGYAIMDNVVLNVQKAQESMIRKIQGLIYIFL